MLSRETDSLHPVTYSCDSGIVVIRIDNAPVNALGHAVREGLLAAIARYRADATAEIAVIAGAGRMFVGGADIGEFGKPPRSPSLPEVFFAFDACEKPILAAMQGAALGGGLELALACHYRLALPGTRLGLPEVTLGLLPGAGGTQKLPRLIGITPAIDMITTGKPVSAEIALETGLIDRIGSGDVVAAGIAYAEELRAAGAPVRRSGDLANPPADDATIAAARERLDKTARGLVAPQMSLQAIKAASRLPFAEGLAEERRLFLSLMDTPQRAGLTHAFFLERKVSRLPEFDDITARSVDHVGVIGGGTMGAGIATAAVLAGYRVTLVERDATAADKARSVVEGNLAAAVQRLILTATRQAEALARMTFVTDYAALSTADLVIEAVFESLDVKRSVFAALDAVAKPGAILATNTSYLNIDAIAATTSRPADVIGLHFFSPAHVMKLLEIVVADATAPDVTATGFAFARRLGKIAVRAGVCDGFIGNRILSTYRAAADRIVLAGASPYQVDSALVDFGFAMGPYAVADLAGLDIGYLTRQRKAAERQPDDIVPGWADELYRLGHLGQKTGRGYYLYDDTNKPAPDDETLALIAAYRVAKGVAARSFSDEEIVRRALAAIVNEAARVLEDGIAARPLDIDAVLLFGYGFPRHRGGPLHHADTLGLTSLLDDLRRLQAEDPRFWKPAPLLERLVAENRSFASLNG